MKNDTINRLLLHTLLLTTVSAPFVGLPPLLHAQAPASSAIKTLLAKAQSLVAHGHLDIAVQTWQQVLLSDPTNREALGGIARADMQLGRTEEAKGYLNRLRNLGGDAKDVSTIEAMPQVQSETVRLGEAGRLARAGNYAAAMKIYRDIYGAEPPAGNIALAYYDTEAATPAERQHAIDGLRRLAQQFPADTRYNITLGRILTYEPKTRPEGIALLSRYKFSVEAQKSLAQAQQWDGAPQQAVVAQPDPAPGRVRVTGKPVAGVTASAAQDQQAAGSGKLAPAGDAHDGAGYRALNSGHLEEAEQQFGAALAASPHDAQALSGMGYVRMKEHNFAGAADYLDRAKQGGATGKGLDDALSLARFWEGMNKAADEQKAGNTEAALDGYRRAQQQRPASFEAAEGAAGALMQMGDPAGAAQVYGRELHIAPARAEAWRGLIIAQAQSGENEAAMATAARVPRELRAQLETDPDYLGALARAAQASGHKAEADRVTQKALALPFPNQGRDLPLNKQMQYASLLMAAQRYEPALALYRQIVAEEPEGAGAWRALIAAEHQLKRDDEALAAAERMPAAAKAESEKNADFLALLGSIYQGLGDTARAQTYLEQAAAASGNAQTGILLQLASIYADRGEQAKAYAIYNRELERNASSGVAWAGVLNALHSARRDREALQRLASMAEATRQQLEADPQFLQVEASIQSANGQIKAALATLDRLEQLYRERQVEMPVDAEVQRGWLMLKAGQDGPLFTLVQNLANTPDMSATDQASFNAMWAAWSLRRAEASYATGDKAGSLELLETAQEAFPTNADVSGALAGAYLRSAQPKRAVAVYATLDMTNATLPLYRGAIGAALAANDMKSAESWLEVALDRYKDDAALLKMAAQYEQSRGDSRKATAYYRAALEAMGSQGGGGLVGNPANSVGPGAPSSAGQQLMRLLAPSNRAAAAARYGANSPLGSPTQGLSTLGGSSRLDDRSEPDGTGRRQAQRGSSSLGDYAGTQYENADTVPGQIGVASAEVARPNRRLELRSQSKEASVYQEPAGETGEMADSRPEASTKAWSRSSQSESRQPEVSASSDAKYASSDAQEDDLPASGTRPADRSGAARRQAVSSLSDFDQEYAPPAVMPQSRQMAYDRYAGPVTQHSTAPPDQPWDAPGSGSHASAVPLASFRSRQEMEPDARPSTLASADEDLNQATQTQGAGQRAILLTGQHVHPAASARLSKSLDGEQDSTSRQSAKASPLLVGSRRRQTSATHAQDLASAEDSREELPRASYAATSPSEATYAASGAGASAYDDVIPQHFEPVSLVQTGNPDAEGGQAGRLQNAVRVLSNHPRRRPGITAQPASPVTPQAQGDEAQRLSDPVSPTPGTEAEAGTLSPAAPPASTASGFASSDALPAYARARIGSTILPPLRGTSALVSTRPPTPREEVQEQLALLESSSSSWIGGTTSVDFRSGQPGFDRLASYSAQVESSSMVGPGIRATVVTRPVLLDAATPSTASTTFRQGTLPLASIPGAESTAGVGGELQIRASSFAASIGYTPYGFLVANATGGLVIHPPNAHFTLSFTRDAVQDTQLSYAGLRDQGSASATFPGSIWGGVVSSGAELQVASGDQTQGWYIQGGGQYITGAHVQDNKRIDGDAGAYWSVWHDATYGSLTVGTNFFGMHYANNLRYFTYGQGGYFSPSAYLLGSVPLTFNGHYGSRFHYRAAGSLGVQAFSEDASAYFPLDLATQIGNGNQYYAARTAVGANYNLDLQGSYAIAEHWYIGGYLMANNSRDYASDKGGFFVRYMFRPQPTTFVTSGPTGLFPMGGLRPLRVP